MCPDLRSGLKTLLMTGTRTTFDGDLALRLPSEAPAEQMQVPCQGRPREQDEVAVRLDAAHGSPMSSARCTGVAYTNPQVREDPGFSLQSAGLRGRDRPLGFRKKRKMRFKIAKNRNSNPRGYRAILVKRSIYKVLKYSSSTCTGVLYLSFS